MIPKSTDSTVISTLDGFEKQAFSVAFSGRAAKYLYDGLYTNKPQSILRELATNAFDSHIEAGIPERPFEIQVPTMLDSTLRVRDYGISMTHYQTMKLYTTIFESSKTRTDDLVGQFGLGSKSPFAYTDSFVVTCWLDKRKRVYVAALDDEGMPVLTHLLTEDSDEETGMEVSFPVQFKHFNDFKRAAVEVAKGFDVIPLMNEVTVQIPILQFENWRIFANNVHEGRYFVRSGCVNYPVPQGQVLYTNVVLSGHDIVIDVPIGSVDITTSREALSMDDDTQATVKAAFIEVTESIGRFINEQMAAAPNFLAASLTYHQLTSVFHTYNLNKIKFVHGKMPISGYIPWGGKDDPALLDNTGSKVKHIGVHSLPTIRILVDRGQKTIRRNMRIAAWRRAGGSSVTFTMVDPTSKDLERVMRRLGLHRNQIYSVLSLPDVPRAPVAATKRTGLYQLVSVGAPKKLYELPQDVGNKFYWYPVETVVESAMVHLLGQYQDVAHLGQYVKSLINLLEVEKREVLILTPMAVKRGQKSGELTDDSRLDVVMKKRLDIIKSGYYTGKFWRAVVAGGQSSHGGPRGLTHVMKPYEAACYEKYLKTDHPMLWDYCIPNREAFDLAVKKKTEELYDEYPLLFSNPTDQHIQDYINLRNNR